MNVNKVSSFISPSSGSTNLRKKTKECSAKQTYSVIRKVLFQCIQLSAFHVIIKYVSKLRHLYSACDNCYLVRSYREHSSG